MKILLLLIILIYAETNENIIFNPKNTIILRGEINENLISNTINKIVLSNQSDIYMYIDSGGGDVFSGNKLIETINFYRKKKKIFCIANYAASMAFAILQSCEYRYGTRFSRFMQHPIRIQINDNKNNIENYLQYINAIEQDIVDMQIKRIKIDRNTFINNIKNDWWLNGNQAKKINIIDKLVDVGCNVTHSDTIKFDKIEKINDKFFQITDFKSSCPLIIKPLYSKYKII